MFELGVQDAVRRLKPPPWSFCVTATLWPLLKRLQVRTAVGRVIVGLSETLSGMMFVCLYFFSVVYIAAASVWAGIPCECVSSSGCVCPVYWSRLANWFPFRRNRCGEECLLAAGLRSGMWSCSFPFNYTSVSFYQKYWLFSYFDFCKIMCLFWGIFLLETQTKPHVSLIFYLDALFVCLKIKTNVT